MKVIETENLTKYYGKARGIVDVNLSVEEGDFFGFIGPNGAGKSTTIRALLGLIGGTSGRVRLFGRECRGDRSGLLSRIGYLPSETMFYSGMRVKEVLRLSADLRKQDCSQEAQRLCDCLQLDPKKKVEELSLGNRKKVGIACALQHRPQLYVLDEPTSGLDPLMQRAFFELLRERNREGATVFLSSHVLSEIQRHCGRAAIIREGRLIAADEVANLARASAKRVTLHGSASLQGLAGVRDLRHTQDGLSFLYSGDIGRLMEALARANLSDLTIGEPDLEEIFLHYYTEGGEEA